MCYFIAFFFNILDFVSGTVKALKQKNLISSVMRDGFYKKMGYILSYALAYLLKEYGLIFGLEVGNIDILMCGYITVTEVVSIIENIYEINSEILPDKIIEYLGLSKWLG